MFTTLKMNIEEIVYAHGNARDYFTKLARVEAGNERTMIELRFFRAKTKPSLIEHQRDLTINEILRHVQSTFPNVLDTSTREFTPAQIIDFEPKRSVKHGANFAQFLAIRQHARAWYGVEEAFRTKMQLAFFGDTAMLYSIKYTGTHQVRVEVLVAEVEWPSDINVSQLMRKQWEESTDANPEQHYDIWNDGAQAEVHRTEMLLEAVRRNLLTSRTQLETLTISELAEMFRAGKPGKPSKSEYAALLNWRLTKTLLPVSELRWLLVKNGVMTYNQSQDINERDARALLINSIGVYMMGVKHVS